jgi:CRP/FNR family transcriptional regulator
MGSPLKVFIPMTPNEFQKLFPSLRGCPDSLLREFLSSCSRQKVPAGAQLYQEGDACSAIAFVLSGEVRVYKIGQTGREITLYEIGPGETCILNASCILS